jgi:hypothetical protein
MVLEATILCIDNSEYVRNSDYLPTRLQVGTPSPPLYSHREHFNPSGDATCWGLWLWRRRRRARDLPAAFGARLTPLSPPCVARTGGGGRREPPGGLQDAEQP